MLSRIQRSLLSVMPLVAVSCQQGPLTLISIDLGTAVDQENRVIGSKNTFAPDDTVYASIATTGGGSATLNVRWTNIPGGSVVHEERRTISSRKPAAFEVHYHPPEGWAVGRHALLFALDADVHTREFKVE